MADPVSDMLIRIKNARRAGHALVRMPYSRFKHEIAKTLERAGMVEAIERKGKRMRKILEIGFNAGVGSRAPENVKLISKPGRRLYSAHRQLRHSRRGGIVIISTQQGVMSSEEARRAHLGGEMIAEVW